MGTRHLQVAIAKSGEKRLSQYGQWDGYPDGQGVEILRWLREADLEKYNQELEKLSELDEAAIEELKRQIKAKLKENPNYSYTNDWPWLSRDCGSAIHKMIEEGKVTTGVQFDTGEWCEGFYTINLKERTFVGHYHGTDVAYSLDDLPTDEEFLEDFNRDNDE